MNELNQKYPGYSWAIESWQNGTPRTAMAPCGAVAVLTGGGWVANFELCEQHNFTTIRISPRERAGVRTCLGSMQVLGALSESEMLTRARVNISKDVHCLNREHLISAIDRGDYECIVT
jgi:hypothetical protein